jgi:2-ketocyclohexanecarboxyl-CoA hydrolase
MEMGLINKVVPAAELDDAVNEWTEILGERSPTALALAKRSFNADSDNIRGISQLALNAVKLFYDTEESKEGVRAFNEKRKPDFHKYVK